MRSRFIYFCNVEFNKDYKNYILHIYETDINLVEMFNEDLSYKDNKILIRLQDLYNINYMLENLLDRFYKNIIKEIK